MMVAARVLVPGPVILTTVGSLLFCMVYPRIVVVVMIAKTIMKSKTSRCGISGTAGAGVVGILLHCLHVGGVLCGFDRRTAYLGSGEEPWEEGILLVRPLTSAQIPLVSLPLHLQP